MINYITYAGTSLRSFNLYVNGRGTYDAPAKSYSMIKIPGRSGDLALNDKRFENIDVKYPVSFIDPDFESNFYNLRAFLYSKDGYQRLEDTYHPDEYRMGIVKSNLEVEMDMLNHFGTFDLVFHCKPQRFLKSGETYTSFNVGTSTFTNPTRFDAQPMIMVFGYGTLGINNQSIIIASGHGGNPLWIDCEKMEAYSIVGGATISKNDKITCSDYKFPVLKEGVNNISVPSTMTSISIRPRWWTI